MSDGVSIAVTTATTATRASEIFDISSAPISCWSLPNDRSICFGESGDCSTSEAGTGDAPVYELTNHAAAVALFIYDNFGRVHQTLRATPAIEPGVASHGCSVEEIVGLLG